MQNKNLKIINWNANGLHNKIIEFKQFLTEHKIDIAIVSESKLRLEHKINIRNFDVYRSDRIRNRPKCQTCIMA